MPADPPKPSPSASTKKVVCTPSSTRPSQSWSTSSQVSVPAGETVASASSQSLASSTWPAGASQASVSSSGSPYVSASRSRYQPVSAPSSTLRSQSWSRPSQSSSAPGYTSASASSQSSPATPEASASQTTCAVAGSPCPSPSASEKPTTCLQPLSEAVSAGGFTSVRQASSRQSLPDVTASRERQARESRSSPGSWRKARPRWEMAFFSSGESCAIERPGVSTGQKSGS